MKNKKRLMVMAGGTGGHVFPGLAVAKKLQQQGWEIRWLGTADRMEADLVPKHGIEIDFIRVKGLRGQGIARLIKAPFQIINAILQARRHMKAWQPDAVLGMGGYVSGPGGIAAWLQGIPVILHEQNAVAGLTNQWLSKIASRVFQAFNGAFPNAPVVGNPVRTDVVELPEPNQRLAERSGPIRVLVMGGSQGARILNQTLPEVMAKLGEGYEVRHQAGKDNQAEVEQAYQVAGAKNFQVTEFIDDVAQAYAWADLLVCRSGALTVSEISAAGVAAIFIPFMHKDRQQALNADHLVECGAAKMIEQPQLTVEKLSQTIAQLERTQLLDMANKARQAAKLDADQVVADAIIAITEK
ncbi:MULTISPECIES: undecaprenyldiphospho-muramoylpentapeptide beta-N-acetylglucosaminyltransferase [Vibrio]|jgi:UDP-N-acetylglucosamine--N-acetylmuramyl-(pentapeptide) pyrophosphoryl-undecaprenol N-acetylglucosamine transferase|uniref:UDP-N-acetylglucosamine--N-acetylmuramyl-(pentapeptide) pyrophosphoryl-undecaprenol N-acetylglucosamine transferase n=1 Tax=Vibrio diazotrophicus TaxID=685 RepID=A0A2J8I355_VIBDI|nr:MULTISPECIES: undecaprenyldiphospho-muramoylpentapeptide beta-N-acetylglucosaminyltransferase [Vibrio]MCF7361288.1 undecaprenyldiphospho-muramoylpentapeptide beta-N-acetylglucosaminyltransferase [Vibrio sp. A1-b2]PNH91884.1 undecaprenyldiphospho-muramoylpentapeptide beta-N-acetylglucosaminyltransferase [Vibrio diazotrophicus]PNH96237.1 undecaprenyldiphospho-muramoylpentapeptide beta-N-acetylglucosaminyltransferase [Vibrio diazotrophicus]PNI04972.1 undecaprenyldiphospho-muramoylpentapeptide b